MAKDSARVEAYGCVDELNSTIGVAVAFLPQKRLASILSGIQNELFNIGSELASEGERAADAGAMFKQPDKKIQAMERLIDEYDARLDKLRTFVLPTGSWGASLLHLSRAVCRRAERAVVRLAQDEPVNPDILRYLNRLSDLLFVMARYANKAVRKKEALWQKG